MPLASATPRPTPTPADFSFLAGLIPQLVWTTAANGYHTYFNQRWFDFTGTQPAQMQGWDWQAVHHPERVERVTAGFCKAVAEGHDSWEDTFPLRRHDGQYPWFLGRALPIHDEAGNTVRWCGTNTDIADQKSYRSSWNVLTPTCKPK